MDRHSPLFYHVNKLFIDESGRSEQLMVYRIILTFIEIKFNIYGRYELAKGNTATT